MGDFDMGDRKWDQRRAGAPGWLAVTYVIGGQMRVFAPRRWLCLVLVGLLPLLGAWYLAATLYLVFHDQLLASLIARQTDMQYAYEDQIAGLRTQLDLESSRGLVDRHTLETTVHSLKDRGDLLESRAAILDRLIAREAGKQPDANHRAARSGAPNPTQMRYDDDASAPRSNPFPRDAEPEKHTDAADTAATIETTAAAYDRVEKAQIDAMAALSMPMLRALGRMRTALAATGLPAAARGGRPIPADVGGPFVPLSSATGGSFEQNAALLQEALAETDRLDNLIAKVPVRSPLIGALDVSSTFGPRLDPFFGRPAMHTGIDFKESYGESVHATAAGIVTVAGRDGGYGTMVEVDHGNGFSTRYAHLSSVSVAVGQKVGAGDMVGHVGSSGRATGPHLHYETRVNGEPVDPTRFLTIGSGLLVE